MENENNEVNAIIPGNSNVVNNNEISILDVDATKKNELPPIKSMTRKQLRKLRDEGLDPMMKPDMTNKDVAVMTDYILDNIYSEYNFDDIDNEKLIELATKTHLKTYGRLEEIKN